MSHVEEGENFPIPSSLKLRTLLSNIYYVRRWTRKNIGWKVHHEQIACWMRKSNLLFSPYKSRNFLQPTFYIPWNDSWQYFKRPANTIFVGEVMTLPNGSTSLLKTCFCLQIFFNILAAKLFVVCGIFFWTMVFFKSIMKSAQTPCLDAFILRIDMVIAPTGLNPSGHYVSKRD